MVDYTIPFIGNMITFGMAPLRFLKEARERYGDVFTFLMFGRRMTYVMGAEGNYMLYNVSEKEVKAEDAYASLTVPVFGKGVVYDVPNAVLMEQKK